MAPATRRGRNTMRLLAACAAVALLLLALPAAGRADEGEPATDGLEASEPVEPAAEVEPAEPAAIIEEEAPAADEGFAPEALDEQAVAGKDIMLGVFFTSDSDRTNSIYASYDGETLYRIATAYDGGKNGQYMTGHFAQMDPSIIYYRGYFWSLSGWNLNDGTINVLISYSKDLVHWTHPEGDLAGNHIAVDSYPVDLNGRMLKAFDTVAPEWFVSKNGSIYIVVSAGYYGDFHGQPTKDAMQAYSIKVTQLSAEDPVVAAPSGSKYYWPNNLVFKTEKAKKLSFTNYAKANFIDGAFYNDNFLSSPYMTYFIKPP